MRLCVHTFPFSELSDPIDFSNIQRALTNGEKIFCGRKNVKLIQTTRFPFNHTSLLSISCTVKSVQRTHTPTHNTKCGQDDIFWALIFVAVNVDVGAWRARSLAILVKLSLWICILFDAYISYNEHTGQHIYPSDVHTLLLSADNER